MTAKASSKSSPAAAAPVLAIESVMSVLIDGLPAGTVVDVLANAEDGDGLRTQLLDALLVIERSAYAANKAQLDDHAHLVNLAAAVKEAYSDEKQKAIEVWIDGLQMTEELRANFKEALKMPQGIKTAMAAAAAVVKELRREMIDQQLADLQAEKDRLG